MAPSAASPLLEQAPESERSDAFSMPVSEDGNSARLGFNQMQNFKMTGKGEMSSGEKSANLDNLDINLDHHDLEHQSDLLVSEIRDENQNSDKKDGEDDMAEMEKLLISGGAFGGKDMANFKDIISDQDQLAE